ncbi:MAG: DUF1080 domain-containing protein [Opitutus sp.]|nr:DUF1080 domain-containing protein [Opitutus sp.]
MKISARTFGVIATVVFAPLFAQPAPSAPPADSNAGYTPIFDGQTLTGWDGDPKYWRVENGCMVGEITPETIIKRNTFIIWRGGAPGDFELKVEYRISDRGNSGINYRSIQLTDARWSLAGYQADIDGPSRHTGQNYEERGRTFLALRGQMVRLIEGQKPILVASLGEPEALKAFVKTGDEWNHYHLIIRGHLLIHNLNGHVMSVVLDDDAAKRRADGLIGVQVHVGPPMKIEYRSFLLKPL